METCTEAHIVVLIARTGRRQYDLGVEYEKEQFKKKGKGRKH